MFCPFMPNPCSSSSLIVRLDPTWSLDASGGRDEAGGDLVEDNCPG